MATNVLTPGTSATQTWTVPVDVAIVADYYQIDWVVDGEVILTKSKTEITTSGQTVTVSLSEEETLLFPNNMFYTVQLSVKCFNDEVLRAIPNSAYTGYCANRKVIS